VKVPNNAFASSFVLKSENPQRKRINYCSKYTGTTRRQNSNLHSGRVPRFREQKWASSAKQNKGHVTDVFWFWGYRNHEYAPDGQTINKEFYPQVLRRLRESVLRKRPEKWRDGDWILHHNNAPVHTSHLVQQFLAKQGTAQLQQAPYSPDLASFDFFLLPRLQKVLKGHRFGATKDIKRNSTKTLLEIPKEEFAKCFQQWQKRWAKFVAAEGNYVEDN